MAIDAARVQIRPWRLDDADALHRLVQQSYATLSPWLAWCQPNYGVGDAQVWIEYSLTSWANRSAFPFAVIEGGTQVLLGGAGLNRFDSEQGSANLGYWVGAPYVGSGIATAAAMKAARFGVEQLHLRRIDIRVLTDNHASLAVVRKLGAASAGILRGGLIHHGLPREACLYTLTADNLT